ncbi:glycosyltransferase [Flavobacterium agricola]|uniref:Glycosyltransferase n=1 Tax=Flavobacterium agricola TaxID=2870839 RepID=A0ABY6M224_9FLAO|nr:glycosyltransferase [Flavobacterium agricola]UYW01288.1 glycosyltransferase [Flavobacterium agricola]
MQISNKTVLLAPLNWGLGHATRCIVVIQHLQALNCKVIVASDGEALQFLKGEFPDLQFLELPSYKIKYAQSKFFFKLKLASQLFKIYKIYKAEKKVVAQWVFDYGIDLIISDNRMGVVSNQVPSVYITHQLTVLSGFSTWLTTKMHQQIIKQFTCCWVPDFEDAKKSLAGILAQADLLNIKKIGPLSRLYKTDVAITIDVLFLVSGPEPMRKQLENIFRKEIAQLTDKKMVLVCGLVEAEQRITINKQTTIYNFATSEQMNFLMNQAELIVCRSGYSTIMDLSLLQKKALLIPTPGQNEQEYLAEYLQSQNFLPFVPQAAFTFAALQIDTKYKGLPVGKPLPMLLIQQLLSEL